ncbi:alpha/beta fold hydrolase [Bradyrhizobium sp. 25ACV]
MRSSILSHDQSSPLFNRPRRRSDRHVAMGESGKPPALLVHGTGFVADVWDEVARKLASAYTIYALDRRGHGASHKPGAYHFLDYAEDVCRVVDALELRNIYGIGHSAGAPDLLLAAKLLPGRFTRLFVMEPAVMDPRAARAGRLDEESLSRVEVRCADALSSTVLRPSSNATAQRRRLRIGPRPRFEPMYATVSCRSTMAGCDSAARRRSSAQSCVRSTRRWSRSMSAMPAVIRLPRSPKSTARCASRPLRSRGQSMEDGATRGGADPAGQHDGL